MSVDRVDLDQSEREIVVTTTFLNGSDQRLRIHVLDTGLRLSGRSVTAGSERYNELLLEPGDEVKLQTIQRFHGQDAETLHDEIETDGGVWNVSGRVQISVDGLSEPLWLPFQYQVDAQL